MINFKSFRSKDKWYEITNERLYLRRREFLAGAGTLLKAGAAAMILGTIPAFGRAEEKPLIEPDSLKKSPLSTGETPNTYEEASTFNNFYEFGLGKGDPVRMARDFKPRPWTISIEGLVRKPETVDVDALIRRHPLEERVYRLRCVEAWSMVIPWVGFPLASLIKQAEPLSQANYVEFVTLYDPKRMPGQRSMVLKWPYAEGLRLDEAMNPLTLLAVGMYGKILPNQNGAPIRLVVPWKYGFKSIKSIVSIRFVREEPKTSWNLAAPYEYGFYANVNPDVDHPRWSQKTERRIGGAGRIPTVLFNGYGEYVAEMYSSMDLRRFY